MLSANMGKQAAEQHYYQSLTLVHYSTHESQNEMQALQRKLWTCVGITVDLSEHILQTNFFC